MRRKTADLIWIILLSCCACLVFFWVARVIQPSYPVKATIRLLLFLGAPLVFWILRRRLSLGEILRRLLPRRNQLKQLGLILIAGAALILLANWLVDPLCRLFGVESIVAEISSRSQTNQERMIKAMIFIPLVNACGEELFFRFFCVLELDTLGYQRLALIFPAVLFSLYHLAIIRSWFSPALLILVLGGLFLSGLVLGLLVRRDRHICGVWLLHGLVNIAALSVSLRFF
ncbi:MAG TPA: hypothetical protein DD640_04645 [Clostridiales bacterium]|nr:hypothetical protein [Clostridiales bacterium]